MSWKNTKRWEKIVERTDWQKRSKDIASYIQPNSVVLEFGCYDQSLKTYLPEGCRYIGSDLYARGEDTLVCDLDAEELADFPVADVAVFAGVLEYVKNVGKVLDRLTTEQIVCTYALRPPFPYHTKRNEFERLFTERGYKLETFTNGTSRTSYNSPEWHLWHWRKDDTS